MILAAQNKGVEAEAEAREMVKLSDRSVGSEDSDEGDLLGTVLNKQGRMEAEAHLREALHRKKPFRP